MIQRPVVIIGGGAAGTLVAAQLLREAQGPIAVALVERAGRAGHGVAYGTVDEEHLLNVPAGRMSALPDEPDHFLRWLDDPTATPRDFVPRRRYGDYLRDLLDASARAAAPGVVLQRIRAEVVDVRPTATGAVVVCLGGERIEARHVVLAIGNPRAADPPVRGLSFVDDPRYVRDPWRPGALDHLPRRGPVLLIGAGLTMVDVALTLARRGAGPFTAISRRGLLPGAHTVPAAPPAGAPVDLPRSLRPLVRAVRTAIAAGREWRAVIDGLRPVTQEIWRALPEGDKRRFLRHVRPYWDRARHRMAPQIAARIQSLCESGVLRVRAARMIDVVVGEAGFRTTLRARGSAQLERREFAGIVNCTGPGDTVPASEDPVVAGLLRNGIIRPGPSGLGLDTADDGALVSAAGLPSAWLFTIGPPRKGNLWETTAIPELREQARALAERIHWAGAAWRKNAAGLV